MFIVFLITTIVFFVVTIRLAFRVLLDYDIKNNHGRLIIKFYFIPIIAYEFEIRLGYIYLINKRKKVRIKVDLSAKSIKFINDLRLYLFSNIYLTNFNLTTEISSYNPSIVALVNSFLILIKYIFYIKLDNNNSDTKITINNIYKYFESEFKIELNIKLFVSLLDLILAFLKAQFSRSYGNDKQWW